MSAATANSTLRKMFIDGKWCEAEGGKTLGVVNPATEEVIADVAYGGKAEARRALEAAAKAMPAWMKLTAWDRAKVLKKTADLMRERADAIARTLTMEQGKPLPEAKAEVLHSADTFEWFAEEGKRAYGQVIPNSVQGKRHVTIKHPVGVVAAISPWNFPITLQSRKIAPALAVGCTIVCKPASQTPLCLIQVFECMVDAGLPAGVANLVAGSASEISDEFLANPICRKISFTGSTEVGKHLMRGCADQMKRMSLELGGHAPFIIFPDADPEISAKIAVLGKFRNNGQVCIAPTRFYVHKDVQKKFTEATVEFTKALKQGNGLDAGTEVGPMFEKKALQTTFDLVEDAQVRRQGTHRRQAQRPLRERLFLRADGPLRPDTQCADDDGRALRARHAIARFQQYRRGDRRGQQHEIRPGGVCLHQRSKHCLEDGRGHRSRNHRHQRSGAGDPSMPLRRHERKRPGPRARARGYGSVFGDEVRVV